MTALHLIRQPKPVRVVLFAILIAVTGLAPVLWSFFSALNASAIGGYNAIDAIGQTGANGAAVYTTNNDYNFTYGKSPQGNPTDTSIDTVNHKLYVADNGLPRVLVFNLDSSNRLIDRVADYVLGQPNFETGYAPGTSQSLMDSPQAVLADGANNRLYVADRNNRRILVFNTSNLSDGMNASYVLGQPDFVTNTDAFPETASSFDWGSGSGMQMALDSAGNRLFVSDDQSKRVLVFNVATITNGEDAVNVLGQSDFGSTGYSFGEDNKIDPVGVAYDPATNYLYVGDSSSCRLLIFDVASITDGESAVHVLGQPDLTSYCSGPPGSPTSTKLWSAKGLAIDLAGDRLFVADSAYFRVTVFDISTITDGEAAYSVIGQETMSAEVEGGGIDQMAYPIGPAYDPTNDLLYIADNVNNRIAVYDVAETITNGSDAVDMLGYDQYGPAPLFPQFVMVNDTGVTPDGVAIDPTGHRLFVSDNPNSRVLVFNLNASNRLDDRVADYVLGAPNFMTDTDTCLPTSASTMCVATMLAFDDANDRLFVSDSQNHRVLVFDVATISNGEAAVAVLGQTTFSGNTAVQGQNGLSGPHDLAYDSGASHLYVADFASNRVMVFDVGTISNGENAISVLGQPDFTTYSTGLSATKMNGPLGVAVDASGGRLFVAESFNARTLVFDVSTITNGESAVNVLSQSNFTTNTPGTTQSRMTNPAGLAYDAADQYLYITDQTDNRILVYDVAAISDGENAVDVIGQNNFTGNSAATTQGGLNQLYDVTINNGDIWVADSSNARVLLFGPLGGTPTPTPTATPPSGPLGTATGYSALMSNSAPNGLNNITLTFTATNPVPAGIGKIHVDFPVEFNLNGIDYGDLDLSIDGSDITLAVASSGATWGANVSGQRITLSSDTGTIAAGDQVVVKIGTHASGGDTQVINPSSTGSYVIYFETYDETIDYGEAWIAITNPVVLTAEIPATFTFRVEGQGVDTLDGHTVSSASSDGHANFGVLTPSVPVVMASSLSAKTNATNGFVVTLEQNHNMLASSGADIDSFANGSPATDAAWSAPTATLGSETTYGHLGFHTTDSSAASLTASANFFGLSGTTQKTVFSHAGPSDGLTDDIGVAKVLYKLEISPLQEVGRYESRLMYIGTATF